MASWGSFAWGFFAGLVVGEAALIFFLYIARQGSTVETVESPLLAAGDDMPVRRESVPVEA